MSRPYASGSGRFSSKRLIMAIVGMAIGLLLAGCSDGGGGGLFFLDASGTFATTTTVGGSSATLVFEIPATAPAPATLGFTKTTVAITGLLLIEDDQRQSLTGEFDDQTGGLSLSGNIHEFTAGFTADGFAGTLVGPGAVTQVTVPPYLDASPLMDMLGTWAFERTRSPSCPGHSLLSVRYDSTGWFRVRLVDGSPVLDFYDIGLAAPADCVTNEIDFVDGSWVDGTYTQPYVDTLIPTGFPFCTIARRDFNLELTVSGSSIARVGTGAYDFSGQDCPSDGAECTVTDAFQAVPCEDCWPSFCQ